MIIARKIVSRKCNLKEKTMKRVFVLMIGLMGGIVTKAQLMQPKETFTHADTLRGSNNENRDWWDVLKYDIVVQPNYKNKTIEGSCFITFKIIKKGGKIMQIDLQDSLFVDGMYFLNEHVEPMHNYYIHTTPASLHFVKNGNVYLLNVPKFIRDEQTLIIQYHGKPREAIKPPWDGGWVWSKDSLGNPWMSVACQGLGASSWFPCKDLQSDEPDSGAKITIIAPDSLTQISNGRSLIEEGNKKFPIYSWLVKNPINTYDIIPYIGKYTNFTDTLMGEGGKLDLSYWVLSYNLERAKKQFTQVKPMLHCFEYWFGKYPFYEDSYKLVEAPYIGMEHQSAVAYGNHYKNGYHGIDLSGSGWGLKWDFIIVHESGHEWFGNSITSKDIADMWIHEGFTNYSETLYTEWLFGKEAGNDYCVGIRRNIENDKPIIGPYGVNKEGSEDMYYKASNMIHNIRHIINNDSLFRNILRGLNTEFYHQTVTTQQIEEYIIKQSGIDFQKTFDQYLRTTQIPRLIYSMDKKAMKVNVHWTNCINEFDMPITIPITSKRLNITTEKQSIPLTKEEIEWFTAKNLLRNYYIEVSE